jgi:hypothetical protein
LGADAAPAPVPATAPFSAATAEGLSKKISGQASRGMSPIPGPFRLLVDFFPAVLRDPVVEAGSGDASPALSAPDAPPSSDAADSTAGFEPQPIRLRPSHNVRITKRGVNWPCDRLAAGRACNPSIGMPWLGEQWDGATWKATRGIRVVGQWTQERGPGSSGGHSPPAQLPKL